MSISEESRKRWTAAQNYELGWWQRYEEGIDWYEIYSAEVVENIRPFMTIIPESRILEIGSGPAGAITFLDSDNKYAIDPLEHYFSTQESFVSFRDPRVLYTDGKAEALPYEGDFFHLIILDNVLDHCEDPQKVLEEMDRVLKPGGLIFFRLNVYFWWGRQLRQILEIFQLDRGHPHSFGKRQLEHLFHDTGWLIRHRESPGYMAGWLDDVRSGVLKDILKAGLFIIKDRALYILEKTG